MNKIISTKSSKMLAIAIVAVLIMSIGISFCVWDTTSVDKLMSGGVSHYKPYSLVLDNGTANVADVGDIVAFGNYYQDANEVNKSPLQWRVVDIRKDDKGKDVLYLLSEKIVAFGSSTGTGWYFDDEGELVTEANTFNSRYDDSTLRAWLNSEDRVVDQGIGFSNPPADGHVVFKGFYKEAFTASERGVIVTRNIAGGKGGTPGNATIVDYAGVKNQKVWTPSITELYGRIDIVETPGGVPTAPFNNDNIGDKQFSYYTGKGDPAKVALTSKFATSRSEKNGLANYTRANLKHMSNSFGGNEGNINAEINAAWWTRSSGNRGNTNMGINLNGTIANWGIGSPDLRFGVRPAICLTR